MTPTFTTNWFDIRKEYFEKHLLPMAGKDYLGFLEIGSYEGKSAIWCLDNVLIEDNCHIVCVDSFMGAPESPHTKEEAEALFTRFQANIEPYKNKVTVFPGSSYLMVRPLPLRAFDFVYIDGSHNAMDVLEDAVLSWRNLRKDGLMAFDDYMWRFNMHIESTPKFMKDNENDLLLHEPKIAIDAFLQIYKHNYKLLDEGHQIWIQKI